MHNSPLPKNGGGGGYYVNMTKIHLKGFTLIELLVVIAIIGLLASIVLVSVNSARQKANTVKAQANRRQAMSYCANNQGVSTLNGNTVYCDGFNNMWSITLNSGGTYTWGPETSLPAYANGDCNNLTDEDIASYPACKACKTLQYAGFTSGWRLPTQGYIPAGSQTCTGVCGRDGNYCAQNRVLWNLGQENCGWISTICETAQTSCLPAWDTAAVAGHYWAATQSSATSAWRVSFTSANTAAGTKSTGYRVRCVLGQN